MTNQPESHTRPRLRHRRVEIAGPEYEASVLELCRLLYEEGGVLPVNWDKVRELVHGALFRQPSPRHSIPGIIGVIGPPERTEATICLQLAETWYSDEWTLKDVFNFVHPDFRVSLHARSMIKFAKHTADTLRVPLFMGVVSTVQTEQKIALFERSLPKVGALFLYRGDKDKQSLNGA
jgi:hypothetical protein